MQQFIMNMQLSGMDEKDGKIRIWLEKKQEFFDFNPFFYVKRTEGVEEAIRDQEGIKSVELERKRLFGKDTEVYRIVFEDRKSQDSCKRALEGFDIFEDDIPATRRFLIDHKLVPYSDVLIENGKIKTNGERCDRELKLLAFDIETHTKGVIDPKKDSVIAISVATSSGRKEVIMSKNEKEVIKRFTDLFMEEDPDVVLTYNGDGFDFPYLLERAKQNRIHLDLGRDGSAISPKRGGIRDSYAIAGRDTVDLYRIVARDLQEVKVKTLDNVAEYLGIMRRDERTLLENEELYDLWEKGETEKIKEYTLADVISTLEIGKKLLPAQMELCRLVKQFLTDCTRMGRGRQVESYLIYKAVERDELLPKHRYVQSEHMYEGGYVMEPERGVFENVVVLDFASMYPNIMIAYNISPDTYVESGDEELCHISPSKHAFLKEPDGFFRAILKELIGERKRLKKLAKDDPIINLRQQSIKTLTNSFYGYTGWGGARWYRLECAEATAAWGRYTIKRVIEEAQKIGIKVIYSDTDSLFCVQKGDMNSFVDRMNSELPLELEQRERYDRIFFAGKKRYAGLLDDGSIVVRGLEVRRGDWCELAKNLQEEIIEIILREDNVEKAKKRVISAIDSIRNGGAGVDELTIYKSISRDVDSYETAQAHVAALKKAMDSGEHIEFSNKISYVVLEGKGRLSDRTKITSTLSEKDRIDKEYYVEKQIIPVALRILEHFGITKEELMGRKQQSLEKWFS
jgi:DNA polymerase I